MRIGSSTSIRGRTPFIGRARERAALREEVERGSGLVTVTGPSGIGKTRLARHVARECASIFEGAGGTWFCSLSACLSVAEAEAAVARTLGIPKKQGEDFARVLAGRGRILLILDNVDAIAPELGEMLGLWLDRCAELQMIATSIIPIELDGEVRFELGPMEAADAVELYLERAHRAWAGQSLPETEAPAIEELVSRLDRIPLAIELAAARVRVLPPRALLSRFEKRFELLRSSSRGRHGSLVEALTLTLDLLPPRERLFLAKASVFQGGFTYEAAMEVLGEEDSELEMVERLDGLRSKALLQLEDSEPHRFHLFESVRDFVSPELEASDVYAATIERHARYFVETGEAYAAQIEGENAAQAFRWLATERENLMAIHLRSFEGRPDLAARAGLVLLHLFALEGHLPTGSRLLETTLEAARRSEDPILIIRALGGRSMAILHHEAMEQAFEGLEEALALARRIGNREEEAHLLIRLAFVHLRQSEVDSMFPLLDRAIEIGRELELPSVMSKGLMARGAAEHLRLATDEAERCYKESLAISRRHGLLEDEGLALTWLAGIWVRQCRFREARQALRDSIARFGRIGNRTREANSLIGLAGVELAAGNLAEAEAHARDCLKIQSTIGDRRGQGIGLGLLGAVALERGELEEAEERLTGSVAILKELEDQRFCMTVMPYLAVLEAKLDQRTEARRTLGEAKTFFASSKDDAGLEIVEVLEGVLELAEARGLPAERRADAQALERRARARLERASKVGSELGGGVPGAIRLLERELELWASERRDRVAPEQSKGLIIGSKASWFKLPNRERVDLKRRVAIRRLLDALAQKRMESPGMGLSAHELFEIGWPGVKIQPEASTRRVYLGVWALRELGLSEILLNQTDGYLLDPHVEVVRQEG